MRSYSPHLMDVYPQSIFPGDSDESLLNLMDSPEPTMFDLSPPLLLFPGNFDTSSYLADVDCNASNIPHYEPFRPANIQNNNYNCTNPCQCNQCNHHQYTNNNCCEPKCFYPSNQEYTSNSVFPFAPSSTNMSSSMPFIQNQSLSRSPPTFTPIIPYGFNQNIPSIPPAPLINHNQCSTSYPDQHLSEIQYTKPNTLYYPNNQAERDLQTISRKSDNEQNKNRNVISTSEMEHYKAPSNVMITNHSSRASSRKKRVKRLKCAYCEKLFATKYELKRHERIHTGERPYKCPLCAKAFRQKQHVTTHMKNVHGDGSKLFKCEMCDKTLKAKATLIRHIKYVHQFDEEQLFQCKHCTKPFKRNGNLKIHLRSMHNDYENK